MSLTARRVRICHRSDLTCGLKRFEVAGRRILVIQLGDEIVALDDTCSHEEASLAVEGDGVYIEVNP